MKKLIVMLLLVFCIAGLPSDGFAADPPEIRFPEFLIPLKPTPVSADHIPKLIPEYLCMIDSDVPLLIFASPPKLVTITRDEGPLRVRGKFVDGDGKITTRTFKGKYIFTIEASGVGRCELIIIPEGAKKEADATRKMIDVDNGEKPPPPEPVDQLTIDVRAALKADVADVSLAPKLAGVYSVGVKSSDTAATWGALFNDMATQAQKDGVTEKLVATQKVIQTYLKANLPWSGASEDPLDSAGRVKAKVAFNTVIKALQ